MNGVFSDDHAALALQRGLAQSCPLHLAQHFPIRPISRQMLQRFAGCNWLQINDLHSSARTPNQKGPCSVVFWSAPTTVVPFFAYAKKDVWCPAFGVLFFPTHPVLSLHLLQSALGTKYPRRTNGTTPSLIGLVVGRDHFSGTPIQVAVVLFCKIPTLTYSF
jgi:hypothetical protein